MRAEPQGEQPVRAESQDAQPEPVWVQAQAWARAASRLARKQAGAPDARPEPLLCLQAALRDAQPERAESQDVQPVQVESLAPVRSGGQRSLPEQEFLPVVREQAPP
jgi:hypothetical protein